MLIMVNVGERVETRCVEISRSSAELHQKASWGEIKVVMDSMRSITDNKARGATRY